MHTRRGIVIIAAGLGFAGCTRTDTVPASGPTNQSAFVTNYYHLDHALPKLRTLKLWVGAQEIEAEVALSAAEIATGMMFRTNLAEHAGMLFVFNRPGPRGFYMKNCVVPLSGAYIDAEGAIDEIVDLQPGVEESVPSRSDNIRFVLEMNQGWFTRHGITTGMVINTSSGPLKTLRGQIN